MLHASNQTHAVVSRENYSGHLSSTNLNRNDGGGTEPQYKVMMAHSADLDELFALRYEVFLASNDPRTSSLRDVDEYDSIADHLIVKADNRIVATYRLMPTDRVLNAGLIPYSANEFDVSALLESFNPRQAVELGRSCVHPAHRNGSLPKLLWGAVAKYMQENDRSDAFGCVSVFRASHAEASGLVHLFKEQGAWSETVQCPPLQTVWPSEGEQLSLVHLKTIVPPLLRSYLMLGAKIYGGPSYDPVFSSHDFLIHFSTRTMSERCRRSFFR